MCFAWGVGLRWFWDRVSVAEGGVGFWPRYSSDCHPFRVASRVSFRMKLGSVLVGIAGK